MPAPFVRVLLVAMIVATAGLAHAQGASKNAPAGPNDGCLMCHSDPSAKSAAGKPIAVDAKKFGASVHGAMGLPCAACHTDIKEGVFPHGTVKAAQCDSCHEKAVKDYAATAHGVAAKDGKKAAATCADCHGSHDIAQASTTPRQGAPGEHRSDLRRLPRQRGADQAGEPAGRQRRRQVPRQHPRPRDGEEDLVAARGADVHHCHGAHDLRGKSDPKSMVSRGNVASTCASCHMNVKAEWEQSQHGKLRHANVMQAPGCTDCHSSHAISQHKDEKFTLAVTESCGGCHAEFAKTYRDTFHGQVTQLGFTQIATCASCHGAHQVLPADNPLSKVSAQNRLATCQECHPKANANFVSYDPHANRHVREKGQLLFFTGKFMDLLLLGVFSVFGVHTILWFVRSMKAVRERRNAPPRS